MRRSRQRSNTLVFVLLIELYQRFNSMRYKPPVTIGLLAINIFAYFTDYFNISENCLLPATIVSNFQDGNLSLNRLVFATLIHGDDIHLYYNMISLGWKGVELEMSMGSEKFIAFIF